MRAMHHASSAALEVYIAHLGPGYEVKILLFHVSVTPIIISDLDIFLVL